MGRTRESKPLTPMRGALGLAIESVMREYGMKQEGLADAADMDVKQVGTYIRGQGNPTYETLKKLCKGLPVSIGRLMDRAEAIEAEHESNEASAHSAT